MSNKKLERAEMARKDRAENDRKTQEKAEKADRAKDFQDVLSGAGRPKGCCELCNYQVETSNGEHQPCKMGHKDNGADKEICADCSDSHYHPKK